MDELSSFSRLVECIYDCSLDASLWPEALERACAFVDGCSAVVFHQSLGPVPTSLFYSWGEDDRYSRLYLEKYVKLNPLLPSVTFLETGRVHALDEVMPLDEFRETILYREWVRPQGILDALHANLERTATGAAGMTIRRREADGLFGAESKSRFSLLVPHLQRALAIGKLLDFHKSNEEALAKTLDGLDAAVLLVAADGRLVHLNQAAAAVLTAATILRAPQGRLCAVDARANAEMQEAIAGAARGDIGLGVHGAAISLASDNGASQVAHVLSLASGARRDQLDSQAVAAIFIRKTGVATPAPLEVVAQLYGLTPAEVRVLGAIAENSGIAVMATVLGVGEATVKTHLGRIFAKTGTRRQADLVRLLSQHVSPLRTG